MPEDVNQRIHFVDIETFGLIPGWQAIFEIATVEMDGRSRAWFLEPNPGELARADSMALNLTRYYERLERAEATENLIWVSQRERHSLAIDLATYWSGHIAGNCISFDAIRLEVFLRQNGAAPRWHYHLVDVEAFAAGALGLPPPWDSAEVSRKLAIDVPADQHTALADAKWSREMYFAALRRMNNEGASRMESGI